MKTRDLFCLNHKIMNSKTLSIFLTKSSSYRNQSFQIFKCLRCFQSIRFYSTKNPETNDINNPILNPEEFLPERIRNFSIIAHIDHGKSTLADRLLEITGTIKTSSNNKQILDKLQVEKERGITVKAQTATMNYQYKGDSYLLNLIDTPGHVDFSYEVSRSLYACEGVILLVDANQGVQAQTVANFYLAFGKELPIIPVLNKIDLKHANPERVLEQLSNVFDIDPSTVLKISAKTGFGVEEVLKAVIERIPPPNAKRDNLTRALLFDSWYDKYKGVAMLVSLKDGNLHLGNNISLAYTGKSYEIKEIGTLCPFPQPLKSLHAGQAGYIFCNMRTVKEAFIGDTVFQTSSPVEPLPGFSKAKPMVFAGVYPMDQSEHPQLRSALEKLVLNDPSVDCVPESSAALGNGWRIGFLGVLHMDVFNQRLEQEYGAQVVLTSPNVPVQVKLKGEKLIKTHGSEIITINNPSKLPDKSHVVELYEPIVLGTIITPDMFYGDIMGLCMDRRGVQKDCKNITSDRIMMTFKLPLNEIVVDFYDKLKSLSSGYASFDYEELGYEESKLVKMDVLLNGEPVEEMTTIVHLAKARERGKQICAKLKETINKHQFLIVIQAALGSKVLAREEIKPLRKDVTAKLYGGDVTRRQKLLKQQAEGKKRMRMIGRIEMPRESFIKILQR